MDNKITYIWEKKPELKPKNWDNETQKSIDQPKKTILICFSQDFPKEMLSNYKQKISPEIEKLYPPVQYEYRVFIKIPENFYQLIASMQYYNNLHPEILFIHYDGKKISINNINDK